MYASVTPTVSTTPAYTAEDQVGGIQTIEFGEGVRRILSVTVVDKGKQSAALKIFLFSALPTVVSVDNGAIDVADAQLAEKCFGVISVPAASYSNVSAASIASVTCDIAGMSSGGKIWAVVSTTGTPTYASTSDLVFRYGAI